MLKALSFLCMVCFCLVAVKAETIVEGYVLLDDSWDRTVYLSAIPTFEEMYTVSSEMIVLWGAVDSTGYFQLRADYLPKEDRLYRIHISKHNDPPATITIGGKEENHFFLILNHESHCTIRDTSEVDVWGGLHVQGGKANTLFQQVIHMLDDYETHRAQGFLVGQQFIRAALYEQLRHFADTTRHDLVSLYALYQTPFDIHAREHPAYYDSYLARWEGKSNSYLSSFSQRLPVPARTPAVWPWALLGGVLIGLGLGLGFRQFINKSAPQPEASSSKRYGLLSLQERNIFSHLREGKSTKEISQALHIEPTTVKSHIRNIYSKLKINNRREAVDFPIPKG